MVLALNHRKEKSTMSEITTKTGIHPSTLGREKSRYAEMLLIPDVTAQDVERQKKIDAQRYAQKMGVTFNDDFFNSYVSDLETMEKKNSSTGKRERDKLERDALILETRDFTAPLNTLVANRRGEIVLTPEQRELTIDKLLTNTETLITHLKSSFDGYGGMTMLWSPDGLLAVHVAGWGDGSKTERYQYSPRKLAVAKRSGYRDLSITSTLFDPSVIQETETETSETETETTSETETETDTKAEAVPEKPKGKRKR